VVDDADDEGDDVVEDDDDDVVEGDDVVEVDDLVEEGEDVAAGEAAVVDDGLEVLRAPPGVVVDVFWVDVFWVEVPGVVRVVSAIKSSANPTGKTSRKPCVKNNRDHARFHRRWTGQAPGVPLLPGAKK
jgi:hypothetical protein